MPFQPGVSGNPAGRPRGSRNKMTVLLETLVQKDLEAIIQSMNKRAKDGNVAAAKLCLNVFGTRRGRAVMCDLPNLNTTDDVLTAMKIIIADVAAGELTPTEGNEFSNLVQRFVEMYGNFHFERRLREVERQRRIERPCETQPMIEPPHPDTPLPASESASTVSDTAPLPHC